MTWVFRPNGEFWSMRGEFRMDAMNPRNPHTWDDLASHPALEKGSFDPSWYDGDVKEDLRRLRDATLTILESFPNWSCELGTIPDDCTMYVNLEDDCSFVGSLHPAVTDDYKQCFFLDVEKWPREILVSTAVELVRILKTWNEGTAGLDKGP